MDNNHRFKLSQNKISNTLTLEYWTKYGDRKDEWLCIDKIPELTIDDLKTLRDYINNVCNRNMI
jgi:hypothetical protein